MNCLRYLRPVGPDILHGGRSGFSGNQGEVLNAPESFIRSPFADAVHLYPGTCGHKHRIFTEPGIFRTVFRQCLQIQNGRMQDGPRKISGEKHIAASSDMENRLFKRIEVNVHEVFLIVIFNEYTTIHVHSERVQSLQIEIMSLFYHQDKDNNYSSQIAQDFRELLYFCRLKRKFEVPK